MGHSTRERKLVVAGLVTRDDGRVLLTRRRADQKLALKWELPGGKVEPGESPTEALGRELVEEIGAEVDVGAIWEVVFHRYDDFDLVMLVYRCTVRAGEPHAVEVADLAWVRPVDVPGYDLCPADFPLAHRLAREATA